MKVDYSTQNGTALAGPDYVTAHGTLSWADGDSASKSIPVTIMAGAASGRSFTVNLGLPNGGLPLGAPAALTAATPSISMRRSEIPEAWD